MIHIHVTWPMCFVVIFLAQIHYYNEILARWRSGAEIKLRSHFIWLTKIARLNLTVIVVLVLQLISQIIDRVTY